MPANRKKESTWLTLGQASDLLGVHPTTLRSWVDDGLVGAFRTPGGHRRFQLSDLRGLLERRRETARATAVPTDLALEQVRNQLAAEPVRGMTWFQDISDAERVRYRDSGNRLYALMHIFVGGASGADQALAEARTLAGGYGREFARGSLTVGDLAKAFLHFRGLVLNAELASAGGSAPNDPQGANHLRRIELYMDELLLATIEGYEEQRKQRIAG